MNKHIRISIPLDETKSFVVTKPLNDSLFHSDYPPFFCFRTVSGVTSGKG
jgi:hypothetical protein